MEAAPNAEIVNLSPIRWLQDPLAEYKKDSDYNKYTNVIKHISNVDVINADESNQLFGINFGDLGIYTIKDGGFDATQLRKKSPLSKVFDKLGTTFMDVATKEGYRGKYEGIFGIINSHYGDISTFISDNFDLFIKPRYTNTNKMLQFKTEEERKNCFEYLTSNFMKAYAKFIRVNQRVPWQFVPYLDYTHPWTDEMLYEYFGLTEDEIKEIEAAPNAEIVNLSPNFYEDYKKLDNIPVAADIEVISREDAQKLFGGIQLSFNLAIQHYIKGKEDKSLLTRYIPETYKIFSKLQLKKTFKDAFADNYNEKGVFVPLKLMTSCWDKNKDFIVDKLGVLVDGKTLDGTYFKNRRNKNVDRPCGGIYFDSVDEAKNFVAYTETKLFISWVKAFHTNSRYILSEYPFMPTYTHPWTDEMLYEYFGLTEEEIEKC